MPARRCWAGCRPTSTATPLWSAKPDSVDLSTSEPALLGGWAFRYAALRDFSTCIIAHTAQVVYNIIVESLWGGTIEWPKR